MKRQGGGATLSEDVVRSSAGYDTIATRFLLLGCSGIVALVVTLLIVALR
jgi:hypothetical protein